MNIVTLLLFFCLTSGTDSESENSMSIVLLLSSSNISGKSTFISSGKSKSISSLVLVSITVNNRL